MSIYKWDERYSVDNGAIDLQHQKLFTLLDIIETLGEKDCTTEEILTVVDDLYSYTEYHFGLEEKLMTSKNYDKLNEHKELHNQFKQSVQMYREQLELFEAKEIVSVLSTKLKDWLIGHILFVDQDYSHQLHLKP